MPYLSEQRKTELAEGLLPTTQGDLTYLITVALLGDPEDAPLEEALQGVVDGYLKNRPKNFGTLCDIIGCLDCAGREYRRRKVATSAEHVKVLSELEWFTTDFYDTVIGPYEDIKIEQNGDVYA